MKSVFRVHETYKQRFKLKKDCNRKRTRAGFKYETNATPVLGENQDFFVVIILRSINPSVFNQIF